jgi:predicted nucleic acid-binding protein
MPDAITNTSPLVYLHRIQTLEWLPALFEEIWTERIEPLVQRLVDAGLWVSSEIRRRILDLAGEP